MTMEAEATVILPEQDEQRVKEQAAKILELRNVLSSDDGRAAAAQLVQGAGSSCPGHCGP